MKYERGSFIVVPSREKLRGMPVPAQALYMWLCAYANEDGECYPSRARLAKDCDCSLNTIDRFTQLLIDRGLLTLEKRVKNGENLTNLYSVVIWGGSPTDAPPTPKDEQRVAPNLNKELYPVLTKLSADEPRVVTSSVSEDETERRATKSRAKYPHAREVFSWFPNPQKSWVTNTTECMYAEYLFARGEKYVKGALAYVAKHKGDEFFYKITKPSDLEKKWPDLVEHGV